jgi:chromate reductase, NAD(P)H dehydrogenase (quinone)
VIRILGISGSLRRDSYNTALLRHAGELFEAEGAQFELYDGLREIPPYDQDDEVNGAPEAVARLRAAVARADGVSNLEEQVREVIRELLAEADATTRARLAA